MKKNPNKQALLSFPQSNTITSLQLTVIFSHDCPLFIEPSIKYSHLRVFIWRRQWQPTPVLLPGKPHGQRSPTFTFMHWRRKWQPTPALLPGESHGRRSLVGCRLRGCAESDTTEATQQQQQKKGLHFLMKVPVSHRLILNQFVCFYSTNLSISV